VPESGQFQSSAAGRFGGSRNSHDPCSGTRLSWPVRARAAVPQPRRPSPRRSPLSAPTHAPQLPQGQGNGLLRIGHLDVPRGWACEHACASRGRCWRRCRVTSRPSQPKPLAFRTRPAPAPSSPACSAAASLFARSPSCPLGLTWTRSSRARQLSSRWVHWTLIFRLVPAAQLPR
jgi:hypothetical protein